MKRKIDKVDNHGLKICENYWPSNKSDNGIEFCKTCGAELWEKDNGKLFCPTSYCPIGNVK